PLRYTCVATGESGCDQYELASPGRDGVFESGPGGYSSSAFDPTDYDADIVVENGEVRRGPEKTTGGHCRRRASSVEPQPEGDDGLVVVRQHHLALHVRAYRPTLGADAG